MSDGAGQHRVGQHDAHDARGRAAVERALAELRRGAGVVLGDAGLGSAVLVVAAEVADTAGAAIACAGTVPSCVVSRARAAALALALPSGDSATVAFACCGTDRMEIDAGFVRAIAGADGGSVAVNGRPGVAADDLQCAAVELVKLARLLPAAIVTRIPGDADGFAARHDFLTVETAWIDAYRTLVDSEAVAMVAHAPVPLEGAEHSEVYAFRPRDGGKEHLAIVIGDPDTDAPVLVRLHSECFTGDLLGSLRCDCGEQLRGAIQEISANGTGVLLYLAQEGRGIGLVNKLRAYRLQDEGFDTIDANERLGFAADARAYRPAAMMLRALGVSRVRLLTNNPAKVKGLAACGIEVVERVPHAFPANGHNDRYLSTKAARAGHLL